MNSLNALRRRRGQLVERVVLEPKPLNLTEGIDFTRFNADEQSQLRTFRTAWSATPLACIQSPTNRNGRAVGPHGGMKDRASGNVLPA